jgi:hypothetical protein
MNPDTPDEVEIGYSSSRMLLLVALASMMTLLSASIAFDWFGNGGLSRYDALAGRAGLVVFGAATCRLIWLLSAARGPVLLIGRYGIRDLRVANEFMLWDSMAEVSTCEYRRRKYIVLKITPALEQQLFISKAMQAMLHANRAMGLDGIAVSAGGLTADFEKLFDACAAYHMAARRAGAAREQKDTAPSQWIASVA